MGICLRPHMVKQLSASAKLDKLVFRVRCGSRIRSSVTGGVTERQSGSGPGVEDARRRGAGAEVGARSVIQGQPKAGSTYGEKIKT